MYFLGVFSSNIQFILEDLTYFIGVLALILLHKPKNEAIEVLISYDYAQIKKMNIYGVTFSLENYISTIKGGIINNEINEKKDKIVKSKPILVINPVLELSLNTEKDRHLIYNNLNIGRKIN